MQSQLVRGFIVLAAILTLSLALFSCTRSREEEKSGGPQFNGLNPFAQIGTQRAEQAINKDEEKRAYDELAMNPNSAEAHENVASMLMLQQKFQEAEKEYLRTIELAPDKAYLYSNMGFLYIMMKKNDKAAKYFQKSLELGFNDPNGHYELAIIYQGMGEYLKAYQECQFALATAHNTSANPEVFKKFINNACEKIDPDAKKQLKQKTGEFFVTTRELKKYVQKLDKKKPTPIDGYQQIKWKTPYTEVIQLTKNKDNFKEGDEIPPFFKNAGFSDRFAKYYVWVDLRFKEDLFENYCMVFSLSLDNGNKEQYLAEFDNIKVVLVNLYGEPSNKNFGDWDKSAPYPRFCGGYGKLINSKTWMDEKGTISLELNKYDSRYSIIMNVSDKYPLAPALK